ncbi:B12-binding domain-containing radical SAM protein [Thermodesulfobacteriota bacterium]
MMRVLLILPDGHIHKVKLGSFVRSMREAPLTLTTLAALAPSDVQADFTLVDENVESVPMDYDGDLVGISVLTGTSLRAYELAGHFRGRGMPVVLGGVHVTIRPEEAALHADIIVIGPAEQTWPSLIRDFNHGRLKKRYDNTEPRARAIAGMPIPRRDLQKSRRYNIPQTIMATRGCRHACDFCSVPLAFPGYTKRPVDEVVSEIQRLGDRLMVFNDVSLFDDLEYSKELIQAMIPLKKRWGGLGTVSVADDAELLELLERSGCIYLLIGFESVEQTALNEIQKGFNKQSEFPRQMKALHEHGISVQGCFMFGFDHDSPTVFEETVDRVNELKVDIPRYSILTPYPGTPLFRRLAEEGRILSLCWNDYDTMHVVFEPKHMTVEELYNGFKWAHRKTFNFLHILKQAVFEILEK